MSVEDEDARLETAEDQAADWIVRQDGEALDEADQAAFAAWLAVPEHRREFDRQNAVWQRYRRMASLPVRIEQSEHRRGRRRWRAAFTPIRRRVSIPAIAASLALIAVGYAEDWPTRLRADYSTGIGERRIVTLADGSVVRMDAGTALSFDRSDTQRTVRLLAGAAQFQVAPDRRHPFLVETREGSVTALGTVFSVREREDGPEVAVLQHSVAIRTSAGANAIVHEGESTSFTAQRVERPAHTDVQAATAWTRGKLIVFHRPLSEVVATIARERRGYWTVRGDAANLRVNGVYNLDRPLDALDALEKSLGLRSMRISDRLIVLSR
ncbi:FecR domain-containing protein [Novosphingobium sp.]|uniref:FecR family protein n=1 Tax=Novosphingobium sp. TaxID=1874826 RepID=UPI0028B22C02|nr:FecR domain-containing protein [Novosphingobium sp.]